MKKLTKFIFVSLGISISFSCNNNTNLKTCSDENAITIAKSILKRQTQEGYTNPNNFVIEYKYKTTLNELLESSKINSTNNKVLKFSCDLNNNIIKYNSIEYNDNGNSEEEIIYYFNNSNNNFYTLRNKNGYKTKFMDTGISKDVAESILNGICYERIIEIKNQDFLYNIENKIDSLKKEKEKYVGKSDEYYKYTFGSNNEKSLQLKIENKDKYYFNDLEGYITNIDNTVMLEDKMSYVYYKSVINAKDKENIYYINDTEENTFTYNYGSAKISTPNVDEYK